MKMSDILRNQGNTNWNYIEIPFRPCENGYNQENKWQ